MPAFADRTLAVVAVVLLCAGAAPAQQLPVVGEREEVTLSRPEGWAMAYMSAATLFHGFGPPGPVEPWTFRVGAGLGSIPHVSRDKARVGFDGTKFEDLNKTPVYGRLRAWLGLPADFTLELGWTPPVEIGGAKPRGIYGLALERPLLRRDRWSLGARLFAQSGRLEGDITCPPEVAALDPGSEGNPFGCREPSSDRVSLDHYGLELTGAARLDGGRLEPFASLAVTRMDAEVQVRARVFGVLDRSVRSADGTLHTVRIGVVHRPAPRWEWQASADYTPLHVRRPPDRERDNDPFWSVRVMGRYAF